MSKRNAVGVDRRKQRERCIVIHPEIGADTEVGRERLSRLEEAVGLARAIDLDIVHAEAFAIKKIRPATLIGNGVVEQISDVIDQIVGDDERERDEMGQEVRTSAPPVIIVDAQLTPVQQRNLERAWHSKVLDRTGLILEIFGARARTREGRMQVDLAQLTYQLGRLVRSWTHLERQRGGVGFMGGPGETQIETDRRLIRQRIDRIKKDLEGVARTRGLHRAARRRVPHPVIALVGYTNAGKSTLFNRLTESQVTAEDQLFATLDPTMRGILLPSGRQAILSDTVGFVSNLPHELVQAFHATLEEVVEADILVHVRDVAHSDSDAQKQDVLSVMGELQVIPDDQPANDEKHDRSITIIEALNKVDLLEDEDREFVVNRSQIGNQIAIPISAVRGDGCRELLNAIDAVLTRDYLRVQIELDFKDGEALAWLYERAEILTRNDVESGIQLELRIAPEVAARFEQTFEMSLDQASSSEELPA